MSRLRIAAAAFALILALSAVAAAREGPACTSGGFTVDDYFDLQTVAEIELSPDGRLLLYAVDSYSEGVRVRDVFLASVPDGDARRIENVPGARDFAWIPGSHELAFLAKQDATTQVFGWRAVDGKTRQLTDAVNSVATFKFAPDGSAMAFTTRARSGQGVSLYDQFRSGRESILIDPATTSSHDFLNPYWHQLAKAPPLVLWVQHDGEAARVPVPGEPYDGDRAWFWSADGRYLSVTFIAGDVPESQMRSERTSIGVFDVRTGKFRVIAEWVPPRAGEPAIGYRGGEWISGERRLMLRRVAERDPWVSEDFPDWAVVDPSAPLLAGDPTWRPVEVYHPGLEFMPLSASEILLSNTVRGVHSLFVLTPEGIAKSEIVDDLDGSSSDFSFGNDYRDAAFVNESLRRPPEIYLSRNGEAPQRLTGLNTEIAGKLRYSRKEVRWTSTDGTRVSGWLLEPEGTRPAGGWPMITHVHGGPAFPFPDAFAAYFDYWPYPLEIYPAHGIAVFLPNYRGTHTYGKSIAASQGSEPIEDIVSGVRHLVVEGMADRSRLGISGHSHGAFVGPLAMVRSGIFEASSFAEGVANSVVMYELMSGDANREIHDPIVGASLYEDPERYLKESADLQMAGIDTASLFEAGAYVSALYMLGFPKAAERAGMPSEFIIYPQTGHNIVDPALQRESAERNLAWFDFWLNGCEASNPTRIEWYRRWEALKRPEEP
ncbi:MAG TPA: prolyl oligopeptidase family serine peptidase [Woeseiaceae bacterium]